MSRPAGVVVVDRLIGDDEVDAEGLELPLVPSPRVRHLGSETQRSLVTPRIHVLTSEVCGPCATPADRHERSPTIRSGITVRSLGCALRNVSVLLTAARRSRSSTML